MSFSKNKNRPPPRPLSTKKISMDVNPRVRERPVGAEAATPKTKSATSDKSSTKLPAADIILTFISVTFCFVPAHGLPMLEERRFDLSKLGIPLHWQLV